ncbi:MAG: YtxH domain-containing protein [Candidatus Saccharicenans sp.]|nr:YtxH domain-containing protein [Candidatus Saccharicenans sp.]MDI6848400.1 YtxH domain-containing protein [Candidatus Saccharicenans sp.]
MSDNKGSSFVDYLLTFMAGAATGFILGILFAPASGKETRQKIKEQAKKGQQLAAEGYQKVAREAEKGVKIAREKAGEGIEAIKEFIEKKKGDYVRKEPEFPEDLDTEK